jgi:phosphoribosylformylglycinamidine synthase
VIDTLLDAIREGAVRSAHDCADGGLLVALAECVMADRSNQTSANIDLSRWSALPRRALLFGEAQGRVVVSTPDPEAVRATAARHGVPAAVIGEVTSSSAPFTVSLDGSRITVAVSTLAEAYHETIPRIMSRAASAQDVALASDSQV